MELGRPSNVGSLVAAVLVGSLALVSNHYARLGARLYYQMTRQPPAASQTPTVPTSIEDPDLPGSDGHPREPALWTTAEELGAALEKLELPLTESFDQWRRLRHVSPHPSAELQRRLAAVKKVHDSIQARPPVIDELVTKNRLSLLRVYFMAAQVQPQQYVTTYREHSHRLLNSSVAEERIQAEALQVYLVQDLYRPDVATLTSDLERFTAAHPDHRLSVELWLLIARELSVRGHRKEAETLLRRGIQLNSAKRDKRRLVELLIDQANSWSEAR
jgi:hypothetical protein